MSASQGNLPWSRPELDACGFPKIAPMPSFAELIEQGRLRAWLQAIVETGCFLVSGEKRSHVIPNPTCKACMARRAISGEPIPKKEEAEKHGTEKGK